MLPIDCKYVHAPTPSVEAVDDAEFIANFEEMKQEEALAAADGKEHLEFFQEVSHERAMTQLRDVLSLLDGKLWQDVPFVVVEFERLLRE